MKRTQTWGALTLASVLLLNQTQAQTNVFRTNVVLNVTISMTAYIQNETFPALPIASIKKLASKDIIAAVGTDIGSGNNIFPASARLVMKSVLGSTNEAHFFVRVGTNDTDVTAPIARLARSLAPNAAEALTLRAAGVGRTNATDYTIEEYQLRSSQISFDLQGFIAGSLSSLVDRGKVISDELFGNAFSASVAGSGSVLGKPAVFQGTVRGAGRKIEVEHVQGPPSTGYPGTFTYHNDNFRSGQNLNEAVLTPGNVNSAKFGKLFTYSLDGSTFASPLYVANVAIPGKGFHNVVYVATEHDSVYAFDADGSSSTPLWKVSLIKPGATTVPAADTGEARDIRNEIGITSTPVIDPATRTLYVVAKTKEISGNTKTYVQRLHALDIATGAEKFGGPVVIQVTGSIAFDALVANQRSALLLANGVVYLAFASHGDHGTYYGWVLGYDATTLQQRMAYNAAPDGTQAGIWMNGDGPAADSAGNIYFITANGSFNANIGGNDYGDSFEKISTSGTVLDYFTPHEQSILSASDLDLCAGGVLLLPDQSGAHPQEMVSAGKNGTIYLVDRQNMGHYDSIKDNIVQSVPNIFVNATGVEGGNFSSPVYFNGYIYFSPVSDNVQAFQLSTGLLSTNATSRSSQIYGVRGGTMAISANGNSNGILWALESKGGVSPGVLHAYDPMNLGNELYNSNQAGSRDTLDTWLKFTVPLVADGKVFVASVSKLTAYGLLP